MPSVIVRHEVPTDGIWYWHALSGPILSLACRRAGMLEFWTSYRIGDLKQLRSFRAFLTGEPFEEEWVQYLGTAPVQGGFGEYHLMERMTADYSEHS